MGDRSYWKVVLFVHWFVRAGEGWGDVSVELPWLYMEVSRNGGRLGKVSRWGRLWLCVS